MNDKVITRDGIIKALAETTAAKHSPIIANAVAMLRKDTQFSSVQILLNCVNNLYYHGRQLQMILEKEVANRPPAPIIVTKEVLKSAKTP